MNIKDHGFWVRYTPTEIPKNAPPATMFCRRESDGMDWYEYVHPGTNFREDTIKMTIIDGAVAAATLDPTALFPQQSQVLEVSDVSVPDPQKTFGRRLYKDGGFADPQPMVIPDVTGDLQKQIDELKAALAAKG
jgi:hypothetical protein